MLVYPSIDKLLEKVNSKYSLVTLASKRAREFEDSEEITRELLDEYESMSSVGKALEEIAAGDLVIDTNSIQNDND